MTHIDVATDTAHDTTIAPRARLALTAASVAVITAGIAAALVTLLT